MKLRLFLSYAHEDTKINGNSVTSLVNILTIGGHDVWFDESLFSGGPKWKEQLANAIDNAHAVIYAMTPHSLRSQWCQWEVTRAINQSKPLVLVKLTELPSSEFLDRLLQYQVLDLSQTNNVEQVAKLLGDLIQVSQFIDPANFPRMKSPEFIPERIYNQIRNLLERYGPSAGVGLVAGVKIGQNTSLTDASDSIHYSATIHDHFHDTDLHDTDLHDTDLHDTDLHDTDLHDTDLHDTDLHDTDLHEDHI
ncbi:MAG: TIR domain-containing protein [Anaerolineae bacterium]|nr:TIR domain-containing protein [Anaerolineae bacterium]